MDWARERRRMLFEHAVRLQLSLLGRELDVHHWDVDELEKRTTDWVIKVRLDYMYTVLARCTRTTLELYVYSRKKLIDLEIEIKFQFFCVFVSSLFLILVWFFKILIFSKLSSGLQISEIRSHGGGTCTTSLCTSACRTCNKPHFPTRYQSFSTEKMLDSRS